MTLRNHGVVSGPEAGLRPAAGPDARPSVFLLCPDNSAAAGACLDALKAAGLAVHVCASVEAAAKLGRSERLIAGLLDLRQIVDDAAAAQVERLAEQDPSLRLVALIDRGKAPPPVLVRLVQRRRLHGFHAVPLDLSRFLVTLESIRRLAELERLSPPVEAPRHGPEAASIMGSCPAMREVFDAMAKVARLDVPVLITGESGTGKELVARAIHEQSRVRQGPFVAINCAGVSPTLVQSELFGHEKGAFTGAQQRRTGRVEAAAGGTCFLDELGDLPTDVQGHLLRFLQEGTIERLGLPRPVPVRTRVVAATNVDLRAAIASGRFRRDLYYRVNGFTIELPPLRERGPDIELLAEHFLRRFARELGRPVVGFRPSALASLRSQAWPGNVRELASAVRRGVILAAGALVGADDLGLAAAESAVPDAPLPTLEKARNQAEEQLIRQALASNACNVRATARQLGVSRMTLYRLVAKHGIGQMPG